MPYLVSLVRLARFLFNLVRLRKISPIGRLGEDLTHFMLFFTRVQCFLQKFQILELIIIVVLNLIGQN